MKRTNRATALAIGSTLLAVILAAFSITFPPLSGYTALVVLLAAVGTVAALLARQVTV